MTLSTQPYKGTRDFFPEEMRLRKQLFSHMRNTVELFGFEEYDGPLLEPFELYAEKTGEEIVNQQLYWFLDRGERKVAIRPEMTPTLARMIASKVNELPKPIRWYSLPNLWRYERPQRGRLREHWQLNCDILGGDPIFADAEILTIAWEIMRSFQAESKISIRINHREILNYFFTQILKLSPDSALKTVKAIDARDKTGDEVYFKKLSECGVSGSQVQELEVFFKLTLLEVHAKYPCPGTEFLTKLSELLSTAHVGRQVVYDAKILRGMDYYTGMVFEIYDVSSENPRALFGGGRYDNLIGLFGKNQLSGVGFGMGDVGLQNFLTTHNLLPKVQPHVDVFMVIPDPLFIDTAEQIARTLRSAGLKVVTPLGISKIANHLKLADRAHARFAVILGEKEFQEKKIVLKNLKTSEQKTISFQEIVSNLR